MHSVGITNIPSHPGIYTDYEDCTQMPTHNAATTSLSVLSPSPTAGFIVRRLELLFFLEYMHHYSCLRRRCSTDRLSESHRIGVVTLNLVKYLSALRKILGVA